ncbi:MAG: GTPase Era [Bdellovibrionales bacterium]|jgi:GTP-binding protein Era|nr:GTPase Era [Bdellovibrionales bacterium]
MLLTDQHPHNKSIVCSVLGVPNVGKSSLINYFLGTDLSIVTPKPQTTRNRIHCILTIDRTEIVFVDTPGIHNSNKEFNKRLNQQAKEGIDGSDINLLLIDLTKTLSDQFIAFSKTIKDKELAKTWVVFTKSDIIPNPEELPLSMVMDKAREIIPSLEKFFVISSKNGNNIHLLTGEICDAATPGPHHYPRGEISNKNQRFFATEYVREQVFLHLRDEIPYEAAVVIDEYSEKKSEILGLVSYISATILVNKPSQRGIVVGSKGSMIRDIGTKARAKIEAMTGGKVNLNLHVKVAPNWFKNNMILEEVGLHRAVDSSRVWRKR